MKKKIYLLSLVCISVMMMVACNSSDSKKSETTTSEEATVKQEEVTEAGMEPIEASKLKDGEYSIDVASSSSMFNITACTLTVKDGQMSAVMTMGGTGYKYIYMGTSEEAEKADEASFITPVENENKEHTFTVPVEALDKAIDVAAFSAKKEQWYDRKLCFKAQSLDTDAYADGVINVAEISSLKDGEYTVEVSLEGGSGKAGISSPAKLKVEDGKTTATIVWSSKNYDYMKVDDVKYNNLNEGGDSTFEIPVIGFDYRMPVIADTVAMSEPHEIEYTLFFDSTTIK